MHEASGTKLKREDIESALANSVGKSEGDIYERIDRRRRALMRDILQKYKAIEDMREKRLKTMDLKSVTETTG